MSGLAVPLPQGVRRLAGRVVREAVAALQPVLPNFLYLVRTMLAVGLALFVSFTLQLQSPLSSVTTVLIVANPVTGALVSKSLWRLFGTVVGAIVAVALMAAFAQSPLLFTVALSLCIGVACIVASLLRFFRSYGAVLAGYTIIIVASGAFAQPLNIFINALSRVSAVSVGIVSTALVFLLTTLPPPARLARTIETLVRDIAAGFVLYRSDTPLDPHALPRAGLLARASALDEMIEYAAADSYVVRRRATRLRLGAARLLGLLSALEPLHDGLLHRGGTARQDADEAAAADTQAIARETMRRLSELESGQLAEALPAIEAARQHVADVGLTLDDPAALTVALHEGDLLEQLGYAVSDLTGAGAADTRIRLRPYLEWATALRNGLRGALVTFLGGLFWYVTQWTAGPVLLSFLVPAACLLATNPSASKASISFATGTVLAIPVALFAQIVLLPQINGFPLLWASLCLCQAPGIWFQHSRQHGLRAFGYVVFFDAMISVRNPITFDDIDLLNGLLAFLIGAIALVLVFRVLLPANPSREARRLSTSLGRAIELLTWRRPPVMEAALLKRVFAKRETLRWEVWQNLQMQKVLRLIQRLSQAPTLVPGPIVRSAFAIVALGRVILTLQALRRNNALPPAAAGSADRALLALRHVRDEPLRAMSEIDAAADAVRQLLEAQTLATDETVADEKAGACLRDLRLLVGLLGEAGLLVEKARGLLDRRLPMLGAERLPMLGAGRLPMLSAEAGS